LREMAEAPTQKECEELRDWYVAELMAADQRAAAETVLRDWEDFVTFYHYPREHWIHLRLPTRWNLSLAASGYGLMLPGE